MHSDDPLWTTGFGSQLHNLLSRLKKARPEWELGALHWNHRGKPIMTVYGYQLLTDFGQGHHFNARWNIDHYQPDLYLTLYDIFVSGPFMANGFREGNENFNGLGVKGGYSKTKWVSWFVYDMLRNSSPRAWNRYLQFCDVPVAMSRYGQESVLENYATRAYMIYHGVDPAQFPELPEDKLQERRMKLGNPDFIMGALFRNIRRKQTARLLEAWSRVSREYPDVKLLMNMQPLDQQGYDIPLYLHHFNLLDNPNPIENPVIIGEQTSELLGVPPDELNMYYQICDGQVLPTQGEGFGIPIIEGYQASGLPVIMTDCSTYPELVGNHGLPVATDGYEWTPTAGAMPLPSTESLEDAMRIMIDDRKLRTKFQQANREFVKQFDFDKSIIPQWLQLIEQQVPEAKAEIAESPTINT